uniref:Uncharacterized protein n=1 Tax=Arundo donax TaxID=35708 RepID=A0A0A9K5Q1_ARUDO
MFKVISEAFISLFICCLYIKFVSQSMLQESWAASCLGAPKSSERTEYGFKDHIIKDSYYHFLSDVIQNFMNPNLSLDSEILDRAEGVSGVQPHLDHLLHC